MLGRDHAMSGAAAFALAAPLLHASGTALAAGIAVAAGAATLPDIDEPGSTIARSYGFLTEAAAWVVHRISGGHRKGTHSVLGTAAFTALAWLAVHEDAKTAGKAALGVVLALLLSAALRAFRAGGHYVDLLGIAGAGAVAYWHTGLSLVPWCTAIGAAAHIAGDMATHGGCPLAWPLTARDVHLLPRPLRFTTGKLAEHWLVSPLLLAALGYAAWRNAGQSLAAIHPHLATGRRP